MDRKDVLQKLRSVLVYRRDAIRGAMQIDFQSLTELACTPGDLAQNASESAHERITSQLAEVGSSELGKIERALERMKAGQYGTCEGCNNPIPLARLKALPYATLCIACQEKLEESGCRDWSDLPCSVYDSPQSPV